MDLTADPLPWVGRPLSRSNWPRASSRSRTSAPPTASTSSSTSGCAPTRRSARPSRKRSTTLKEDGASFKLKARAQSEELLKTSWALIHKPLDQVSASVKAQLIMFTVRCAGLDASVEQKARASANASALAVAGLRSTCIWATEAPSVRMVQWTPPAFQRRLAKPPAPSSG